MKNKKGMTLIEVIVALFLIGLIASSFLPSIMSSFTIMKKGKGMTVETFKTQQDIELAMEQVRDDIDEKLADPTKTDPRNVSITAFGKTIKGVSNKQPIVGGSDNIYAFVANGHIVEENLPVVSSIKLDQSAPSKITAPKQVQGGDSTVKLQGNHDMASMSNYFTDLKKWYVSKEGFDGFIPEIVTEEEDWGNRYPSWPNDYTIIKDIDTNILEINKKYAGKHIVYSVIPISKTGRYGLEVGTNPVYVNGPPTIDKLSLHLDASILENKDNTTSPAFKNWNDLSVKKNNATTSSNNVKTNYDDGRVVQLRSNLFTVANNTTTTDTFTMFVVFSNTSVTTNKTQNIIQKNSGGTGWTFQIEQGKLQFFIDPSKSGEPNRILTSSNIIDSRKHIATIQVNSNDIKMTIDTDRDKDNDSRTESLGPLSRGSNSAYNVSTSTIIGSGSSELNISEIIIFEKSFTTDAEVNEIRDYLSKKHRVELAIP